MSIIDLESCLEPLAGDSPTGEDLEYDQEFVALELASQGTPDRVDRVKDPEDPSREIDRVVPGKEPDYSAMKEAALALFGRTKDLRVAMHIVAAATKQEGLAGLAAGTGLIAGLLDRYWDEVHPRLLADDDFDPSMRVNVLGGFSDPAGILRVVKACPMVEARAIGRFTIRDLEVSTGEAAPLEGQTAATKELLAATAGQMEPDELAKRAEACQTAKANLSAIYKIFNDRTSAVPDVAPLRKLLDKVAAFYGQNTVAPAAPGDAAPEGEGQAAGAAGFATGGFAPAAMPMAAPGAVRLASRQDAKELLEKVCEFLERTEPAHPAPILVRRAVRLLDMNFLEIMKELTPDVVEQIHKLGGIKDESSW